MACSRPAKTKRHTDEPDAGPSRFCRRADVSCDSFRPFLLRGELTQALNERQICEPTDAQERCLPVALTGDDFLCQSRTGSGKTLVFVLASLQKMSFGDKVETVVVVPTRELAVQIAEEFKKMANHLPQCRVHFSVGGLEEKEDRRIIKLLRPNVIVGTPGRLHSHVMRTALSFRHVQHFIMDECDKLLAPEWRENKTHKEMNLLVRELLAYCSEERQVMMFTATMTRHEAERERRLLKLMHCPKFILVEDPHELVLTGVLQYRFEVESEHKKPQALFQLLETLEFNQVAVFVNSVQGCEVIFKMLQQENYVPVMINSAMDQEHRLANFQRFRAFRGRVLVCTDLMGRGIDIKFVTLVINYDMPQTSNVYLHRVGRTGRLDTRGLAVSMCVENDRSSVELLGRVEHEFGIEIAPMPETIDPKDYLEV